MSKAQQRVVSAFSAGKYAARTGATKKENPFVKGYGLNSVWHAGFKSAGGSTKFKFLAKLKPKRLFGK